MIKLKSLEVWFVTGSQHLYGPETLKAVAKHSQEIAKALNAAAAIPVKVVFKPVMVSPDAITELCQAANNAANCIGLITWCHTFSPSKMWINGLKQLRKPIAHLHTQYNRDIPWSTIDMDFMNMNQAAHGDREHGFIMSRLRMNRKVVVGFWQEAAVQAKLGAWARAAAAWHDWQGAQVRPLRRQHARSGGDRRRQGRRADEVRFLRQHLRRRRPGATRQRRDRQGSRRACAGNTKPPTPCAPTCARAAGGTSPCAKRRASNWACARSSPRAASKASPTRSKICTAWCNCPASAPQRLMADGYGFGGEGDWKTAALVRAMKVMASGLKGGTSFMEDYTYHLNPDGKLVLGAHMLEICPSIADGKAVAASASARHRRQGRSGAPRVQHARRRRPQCVARWTWATASACS